MQHQEFRFQGAGGLALYGQSWKPGAPSRGLVVITHGHGEHSGRYRHVAASLVFRGLAAATFDLRGHGQSEGPRGFVRDWDDYRQDLSLFLAQLTTEFAGTPLFLYGHSVGGTVVLDYVLRDSKGVRGVIASAPSLGKPNIPAILFSISKVLSVIYPGFSMATQLDQSALSRDPEVVRAYKEDPLVHSVGTARLGTELLKTAEWIQAHAAELQVPLLLIHGSQDRLVRPADSRRFFENLGSQDKTYMDLPDGYHEPHNDLDQEKVLREIGDWILKHC